MRYQGRPNPALQPEPAVSVSGVAILPQVANRCSDLCQKSLPVFGCPAVGKPTNRDNRRSRKAAKKASRPNAKSTMFEFACSEDSQMGFTHQEYGINHVRLCKDRIDLGDESQCEQLDYQIDEAAKVAPPHMWASIPCTSGSPWQYINRKRVVPHSLGSLPTRSKSPNGCLRVFPNALKGFSIMVVL